MSWNIKIGNYTLALIEKVLITRSVERLADEADIILPATSYNVALEIENKIAVGDKVTIELGYNDNLVNEFEGYLDEIKTDGGSLTLKCIDALYLYRAELPNTELKQVTVKQVVDYVHKTITGFTIDNAYDFTYEKFVIKDATGFDVLKKIQEEAKPNIYIKGNTLYIQPLYVKNFGKAIYDFSINIDESGTDLTYKDKDDRKFLVTVESKDAKGKPLKVTAGTTGGESLNLKISGVTDTASLQRMADQALEENQYTGYDGKFVSWLVPYCDAGYDAVIKDPDYEFKNGRYYVIAVVVEFSAETGGKRTIELGKKVSDE